MSSDVNQSINFICVALNHIQCLKINIMDRLFASKKANISHWKFLGLKVSFRKTWTNLHFLLSIHYVLLHKNYLVQVLLQEHSSICSDDVTSRRGSYVIALAEKYLGLWGNTPNFSWGLMLFHPAIRSAKSSTKSFAKKVFIFLGRRWNPCCQLSADWLAWLGTNQAVPTQTVVSACVLPDAMIFVVSNDPSWNYPESSDWSLWPVSRTVSSLAHRINRFTEQGLAPASMQHSATSSTHCTHIIVLFMDHGPALDAIIPDCLFNSALAGLRLSCLLFPFVCIYLWLHFLSLLKRCYRFTSESPTAPHISEGVAIASCDEVIHCWVECTAKQKDNTWP